MRLTLVPTWTPLPRADALLITANKSLINSAIGRFLSCSWSFMLVWIDLLICLPLIWFPKDQRSCISTTSNDFLINLLQNTSETAFAWWRFIWKEELWSSLLLMCGLRFVGPCDPFLLPWPGLPFKRFSLSRLLLHRRTTHALCNLLFGDEGFHFYRENLYLLVSLLSPISRFSFGNRCIFLSFN